MSNLTKNNIHIPYQYATHQPMVLITFHSINKSRRRYLTFAEHYTHTSPRCNSSIHYTHHLPQDVTKSRRRYLTLRRTLYSYLTKMQLINPWYSSPSTGCNQKQEEIPKLTQGILSSSDATQQPMVILTFHRM